MSNCPDWRAAFFYRVQVVAIKDSHAPLVIKVVTKIEQGEPVQNIKS
jgi:hypothetical protein